MNEKYENESEYDKTLLFAFFLGIFGIHRFIHGKIITGIIMLLTCGGLGIWAMVDIILIISQNYKNRDGNTIRPKKNFLSNTANIIVLTVIILGLIFNIFKSSSNSRQLTNSLNGIANTNDSARLDQNIL